MTLLFALFGLGFASASTLSWLFGPAEVGRVYRFLEMVGEGCPGHGPTHLLCCKTC